MPNSNFIRYINTLHNVGANNENAIAEAQQTNRFFNKIFVERPIAKCLEEHLTTESGRIVLLTGHAGDGKTSLLLQLLKRWGKETDGSMQKHAVVILPSGKRIRYIKDFSELTMCDQQNLLHTSLEETKDGISTILIANTGPLLKACRVVLGESAEMQLINEIDDNTAKPGTINGYDVLALNIAGIDNTSFVRPFLEKMLAEECWSECNTCAKSEMCPILFNRKLIVNNFEKMTEFVIDHYIWQQEHGRRLTIRQITAHLAYAVTGNLQCEAVDAGQGQKLRFEYLVSNLFFGFKGLKVNREAVQLEAIKDIKDLRYDQKRLFAEEELFIKRDFCKITEPLSMIAKESGESCLVEKDVRDWQAAVKRMYMLFNLETDSKSKERLKKNLFSRMFPRYLALRQGSKPGPEEKKLIREALSMLFTGFIDRVNTMSIPLTLRRENGVLQNVQLSQGRAEDRHIKLSTEDQAAPCFGEFNHKVLRLAIENKVIAQPITLPLLNYFDDLRQGILSTNVDPQLTQGIDSIKAQILSICQDDDVEDMMELIVLKGDAWGTIGLYCDGEGWRIQ